MKFLQEDRCGVREEGGEYVGVSQGGEGGIGTRTLLVGVEGGDVAFLEGELGEVVFSAGRIPLLRKQVGVAGERGIIYHLHGELETLTI